jgi:hypothetical protein
MNVGLVHVTVSPSIPWQSRPKDWNAFFFFLTNPLLLIKVARGTVKLFQGRNFVGLGSFSDIPAPVLCFARLDEMMRVVTGDETGLIKVKS